MVNAGVIKVEVLSGKYPLTRVADKMMERAFQIAVEQAKVMQGYAQVWVPVETGSLRNSIRLEIVPTNSSQKKSVRVRAGGYVTNPKTGKLVDYARFQEEGTKYIVGSFYMRRAFAMIESSLRSMLESMEESLSE